MNKKIKHSAGYILIHQPNHPACSCNGFVYEHRLVMEKHLDRYLTGKEVVHHINKVKDDNRLENLLLLPDTKQHIRIHRGWIKKDGKWFKTCSGCKRFLEINKNNFYFRSNERPVNVCKSCSKKIRKENNESINESRRKRRMNKEYREQENAWKREWRKKNPERAKANDKKYNNKRTKRM